MKRYLIIVAGGKGARMGGEIPKQFLCLKGRPILMHTIELFYQFDNRIEIILVLPQSQQHYWQELTKHHHFAIPYRLTHGGETRFESVRNGLHLIPDNMDGVVGIHDGVRPLVSSTVVERCYTLAAEKEAVVPVIDIVETIRQLHTPNDLTSESENVPRETYKLVQTPQVFTISLLKQAYRLPYSSAFTDDASVVEALGRRIFLVEGNRENIKITTPTDMLIAEQLI